MGDSAESDGRASSAGHEQEPHPSLDLDRYLRRIGWSEALSPSMDTLRRLHMAHATTIPFENLDILLGRPIRLDLSSLQSKLVSARRGGYCFEQNLLFAAILEELGYSVTRLGARVRLGRPGVMPRTHMVLRVDVEGRPCLADVGFGGEGLPGPLPMEPGPAIRQFGLSFRMVEDASELVLQSRQADGWLDLYGFTQEAQHLADYVRANHFTSTHPDSPFVRMVVVQLPGPKVRWVLRGRELTKMLGDETTTRLVADEELLDVLADPFGLHFPPDTRFP